MHDMLMNALAVGYVTCNSTQASQQPAPPSPSQVSMRSEVDPVEHSIVYLPGGHAVLMKVADPSVTVVLPQNPSQDYEIQKSRATGIEAVSSISLGTVSSVAHLKSRFFQLLKLLGPKAT